MGKQMHFFLWWPPTWSILDQIWSYWTMWWPFRVSKGQIWDYLGPQNGSLYSWSAPLGAPWGAQKVQKWVSDNHLATIGQLDHYVVFGTKSGTVQDFQRCKKCPIWVKQTTLDPPSDPPNSPNHPQAPKTRSVTLPTTNLIPLVILQLTNTLKIPQISTKTSKMPKTPKNAPKWPKIDKSKNYKSENWPILYYTLLYYTEMCQKCVETARLSENDTQKFQKRWKNGKMPFSQNPVMSRFWNFMGSFLPPWGT